jgi:nuclear pore complex protein Nup133
LDNQVDIIIKAKARKLRETKGFASVYKDLVKQLLQGKALSIEDAVDLLTLKDNLLVLNDDGEYEVETVRDYATALYLLSSAHVSNCSAFFCSTFELTW